MVITETRRVDTTWIIGSRVADRSILSDELAQFCAKYQIYHVKKAPDSLAATGIQTEGEKIYKNIFDIVFAEDLQELKKEGGKWPILSCSAAGTEGES